MTTLPWSRPLTAADLELMPDDGHRYELLDGALIVTPSPVPRHQLASSRLQGLLIAACPDDLVVLSAPCDVVLADDTVLQPDLLVTDRASVVANRKVTAPVLVVEILSPSTRMLDLHTKRARFELSGIASYWVVDPTTPSLTAWELRDGAYAQVAHAEADEPWTATAPYGLTVTAAELLR
ncbi:Uma2 family endonuclease [Marmoricola bigeumensis]|uniref:Uma2 family endonuclease n=1 Tax=Nocardioides marmoribigeumensis TaxID=433649 RepID=A0ABU2C194_9ACTN|nr:Uma2 family endonuclease [Nocardioides marmoribigeumensis]